MITKYVRIAKGRALFVIPMHATDRRVHVNRHRLVTRPRTQGPGSGEHCLGDLLELADISEVEAPEEGAKR